MSLDRDFEEASAVVDLMCTDSGVSLEAEIAYLYGEGPDPWPHGNCDDPVGRTFMAMINTPAP